MASNLGLNIATKKQKAYSRKPSAKSKNMKLGGNSTWTLITGFLTQRPGRPTKTKSLFRYIGEKIPYEFLGVVEKQLEKSGSRINGVYIAHDSMGYPRYVGRGNIFNRLRIRKSAQILELAYFSFYVVENKMHEREIETIMIRAAGPLLDFNSRKVRNDIMPGSVLDFEPGTKYVERQYKKGKK